MKKTTTLLALAALLPMAAWAQKGATPQDDTAAAVVDRYVAMMNIEGLPQDSLLVMETAITFYGSKDTVWMKRWFAQPQCQRVEVWCDGKLETGLVSNGKDRFRRYVKVDEAWESTSQMDLLDRLWGYDFRGPLHNWRAKGATLKWNGVTTLKGQSLQVVMVQMPDMYTRYYMFEPGSGLLTLIIETDEQSDNTNRPPENHTEWKSMHEYQPIGKSLLPSLESFLRNGVLTVMSTAMHFEKLDLSIFEKD
ncbi:MAG: hypothetical protein IJ745_01760 [Bacteroidales bacterium]|nr:hypothetical protein [Bacteroidales bacterium]